jgi:opacity protein-like surface antigen
MTRTLRLLAPAFLLGAALALPAHAQTPLPLSFEVRGGVGIPVGDLDDGTSLGWSVSGTVFFRAAPIVSVYGGFEHTQFTTDDAVGFEQIDPDITDNGFRLGARFDVPFGGLTGVSPWVEGGATFNRTSSGTSITDDGINLTHIDIDSKRSVGFEVGAGLSFAVAPRISLTPGVRYRSHKADFSDTFGENDSAKIDVNHFTIDLGVHVRL